MNEEQTEVMRRMVPFAAALGVDIITNRADEVRARVEWRPERCTTAGVLHCGVIMSLADTTGAACAFLNLPEGAAGTTTIESKTNFLRAVREGYAEAASRPLHTGRTVVVIETDVTDADGRRVAKVLQTRRVEPQAHDPHQAASRARGALPDVRRQGVCQRPVPGDRPHRADRRARADGTTQLVANLQSPPRTEDARRLGGHRRQRRPRPCPAR